VRAAGSESVPTVSTNLKGVQIVMKKTRLRETLPRAPKLQFSPTAWAKLLYVRDAGDTEIGGFAVTRSNDPLFVEDLVLVAQFCTAVHVEFDDNSVADYFHRMVDAGRRPEQFGRIWVHTHPGNSAQPSGTDEVTFARAFGRSDWAVMFILARGGQMVARLRYNSGPGVDVDLPVEVAYAHPFAASDEIAWQAEYTANVQLTAVAPPPMPTTQRGSIFNAGDEELSSDWNDPWDDHFYAEGRYGFDRDFG
jgi:proteasome lid subunit RPN8/RPN11